MFLTAFTPTQGLAVTHLKNCCNLRIWFADSHSNLVSMLRVGQPGSWFARGAGIIHKIQVFPVMTCRPVSTRSYRRVTPRTVTVNIKSLLSFETSVTIYQSLKCLFLWFFTPCRVVSWIQHLNVPSPHSVTLKVQVPQFSELLEQTHYCTRCKSTEVINHVEQGPFWEANSSSASQIPPILWNQKFPNSVHKSSALVLAWARSIQSTSPVLFLEGTF